MMLVAILTIKKKTSLQLLCYLTCSSGLVLNLYDKHA